MSLRLTSFLCVCCFLSVGLLELPHASGAEFKKGSKIELSATDWPWWRGPNRNGIASADQTPPLKWGETENVVWKSPIPGKGYGSPVVVGERIYLATAEIEEQVQSVLCYDNSSGKLLWKCPVHEGGLKIEGNNKASLASATVACDGERLLINFLNSGSIYTSAVSLEGELLWQTEISPYVVHQGYGSSPAIYDDLVIVTADNKGGGAIAGLNRVTGKIVWKKKRPDTPNYPSPIIYQIDGKDQVFLTGCNLVTSFDPLSGEKNWEIEGATTECVTSTVTDGVHIFTSGGYPKNHVAAVKADGSGVVWEKSVRTYVPSMIVQEGHLFAVTDRGVAMCWESATGKEIWKGRLRGTFSSSPVLVGDHFYVTNEEGKTFIFSANTEKFELIGENQLGDHVFATPTFCNSHIYMRLAKLNEESRQEYLYKLGE